MEAHIRFLVALPVLIFAELVVHQRSRLWFVEIPGSAIDSLRRISLNSIGRDYSATAASQFGCCGNRARLLVLSGRSAYGCGASQVAPRRPRAGTVALLDGTHVHPTPGRLLVSFVSHSGLSSSSCCADISIFPLVHLSLRVSRLSSISPDTSGQSRRAGFLGREHLRVQYRSCSRRARSWPG